MGRSHVHLLTLFTCHWLLCGFDNPPAPVQGQWITFGSVGASHHTTPTSHIVGDGIVTLVYSLRLSETVDGSASLLTPANFHDHELRSGIRGRLPGRPPPNDPDPYSRYFLLVDALRHFRPETGLQRNETGEWRVIPTDRATAYQACVRQRIDEAVDRIHGRSASERQENEREGREVWARAADPPLGFASQMLGILGLTPTLIESGSARQAAEQSLREHGAGALRTQIAWRAAAIVAHGREFVMQFDLLADPHSPANAICRPANEPARSGIFEAPCTVHGVLDQRDGWPIQMRVMRTVKTSSGEEFGDEAFHMRLAPLEDFVAPPNPCPSNNTPAG